MHYAFLCDNYPTMLPSLLAKRTIGQCADNFNYVVKSLTSRDDVVVVVMNMNVSKKSR